MKRGGGGRYNNRYKFTEVLHVLGIFTTARDIENATKEILKMYRFNHLNVMSLIGVCMSQSSQGSSSGPSMVMPFMAKGSLLDYLRKEASNLKATRESEVKEGGREGDEERNFSTFCMGRRWKSYKYQQCLCGLFGLQLKQKQSYHGCIALLGDLLGLYESIGFQSIVCVCVCVFVLKQYCAKFGGEGILSFLMNHHIVYVMSYGHV